MDKNKDLTENTDKAISENKEYISDWDEEVRKIVDMAYEQWIRRLKEQETILLRDGHHVRCMQCGEYWCDSDREGNPFPMNFCPNCGKAVK